ncbi:MAG: AbrB/MazE/SpoVT family DNA-binding domain-containing protein [Elusimicrobia bacterium]|nr:AbrB/MazE/SpoVT family DNA-binding domain-containing protein [Elusimicrobiota bacterium]
MHLTQKGQVTVPQKLREKFGLNPNVEIDFREEEGKLVLIKKSASRHALDSLVGILKSPQSTDRIIHQLRGKP